MLSLEEKALNLWQNGAITRSPCFVVVGLDHQKAGCLSGAVCVDCATGTVTSLASFSGLGGEAYKYGDDDQEIKHPRDDRPWMRIEFLSPQDGTVKNLRWKFSRANNITIDRCDQMSVPLIFYNMGNDCVEFTFDKMSSCNFTVLPGKTKPLKEDTVEQLQRTARQM